MEPEQDTSNPTVGLVRRYLHAWGLVRSDILDEATQRVVSLTATNASGSLAVQNRRAIILTRRWVENFIHSAVAHYSAADAFWRARTLLARFPSALLDTPLPSTDELREMSCEPIAPLLPECVPGRVKEQSITLAMARLRGFGRPSHDGPIRAAPGAG